MTANTNPLPRHKFWGAGEPDCPQELKASNGELHTARCKVCGDGWRKSGNVCLAAHVVIPADLARRLLERLEFPGPSWAEHRAEVAAELRAACGVTGAPAALPVDRLEQVIDAYLEGYEMVGEAEDGRDACHQPSDDERALIKDAILGLLADPEWDAEWGKLIEQRAYVSGVKGADHG
jgi:hypothetical protein